MSQATPAPPDRPDPEVAQGLGDLQVRRAWVGLRGRQERVVRPVAEVQQVPPVAVAERAQVDRRGLQVIREAPGMQVRRDLQARQGPLEMRGEPGLPGQPVLRGPRVALGMLDRLDRLARAVAPEALDPQARRGQHEPQEAPDRADPRGRPEREDQRATGARPGQLG